MRIGLYLLFGLLLILPTLSYAVPPVDCTVTPTPAGCGPLNTVEQVVNLLVAIVEQMQVIFWIVAAGSALYAAFLYIRGGSSSETLKKAQKQIIYTVIAVALGVIAYGIPSLVNSFLSIGK